MSERHQDSRKNDGRTDVSLFVLLTSKSPGLIRILIITYNPGMNFLALLVIGLPVMGGLQRVHVPSAYGCQRNI